MAGERGFTLIEVLVALAIAALAVAVVMQTLSVSLLGTDTAIRAEEAISRATSRLAAARTDLAGLVGVHRGEDGDLYRWSLDVEPVAGDDTNLAPDWRRYDVVVVESWTVGGRTRSVTLRTRCLRGVKVPAPPKPGVNLG